MAKGLLSLELSYKKIRYVYGQKTGRNFCLMRAGALHLQEDAPAPDSLTKAIEGVLVKEDITPSKIFVSVFRDDTVIYQISIPKMARNELEEVIKGEIEKIPAFSEKEFEYLYSSQDLGKDRQKVIFTAVSKNILDYIVSETAKIARPLEAINVAPLDLISVLSIISRNKARDKAPEPKEDCLVVLDEKMSYVVVLSSGECRFFYISSTGTADLFASGKDRLNNKAFNSWSEELSRILKSYQSDNKKEDIDKLYLVWDSENAAGLDSALSSALNREVQIPDFNNIPGIEIESQETGINPIYWLAASPLIGYINKLKSKFTFREFLKRIHLNSAAHKAMLVCMVLVLAAAVAFGTISFYFLQKKNQLAREIAKTQIQISQLKQETEQLDKERKRFQETKERLLRQATFVKMLNRISWSRVFGSVAAELPDELALTAFKINEKGEVSFDGEAFKVESVAELMRRVDSSSILSSGKFDFLKEKEAEKKKIFSFGVKANFQEKTGQGKDRAREEK